MHFYIVFSFYVKGYNPCGAVGVPIGIPNEKTLGMNYRRFDSFLFCRSGKCRVPQVVSEVRFLSSQEVAQR